MLDHALLNVASALSETASNGLDSLLARGIVKHVSEQGTWLLVVGVGMDIGVSASLSDHVLLFPGVDGLLDGSARDRVWLVVGLRAISTIDDHDAIAGVVVTHASAVRAVDGNLVV